MKLYYAPGVCSIGIHVLLEEIGKPYELEAVNLREGAQYQPGFTAGQREIEGAGPAARRRLDPDRVPGHRDLSRQDQPRRKLIPQDLETEPPRAMRRWNTRSARCTARASRASSGPAISARPTRKTRSRRAAARWSRRASDPRQGACRQELSRRQRPFGRRRRGVLRRVLGRRPPQHETPRQRRRPLRAHEVPPRGAARDAAGRRGLNRPAPLTHPTLRAGSPLSRKRARVGHRDFPSPACGRGWIAQRDG